VTASPLPTAEMPTTMNLTAAAAFLGMSKSNVRAFLERRGIEPFAERAQGSLWLAEDVERAKREYDASGRREADERRRAVMRGEREPAGRAKKSSAAARIGPTQRSLLRRVGRSRKVDIQSGPERQARRRLIERGLVVADDDGGFELTASGRRARAAILEDSGRRALTAILEDGE